MTFTKGEFVKTLLNPLFDDFTEMYFLNNIFELIWTIQLGPIISLKLCNFRHLFYILPYFLGTYIFLLSYKGSFRHWQTQITHIVINIEQVKHKH